MRYPNPDNHIAVLIDAENVSPSNIEGVLQELSKYGTISVRRIYGDWSSPQLAGWRGKIQQHSLKPQQQFSFTKGKNSSDIILVNLLRSVIVASEDEDGWAQLSSIGATLRNRSPEFDSRTWGYAKLKDLITAVDLFEVGRVQTDSGHTNIRVRIKK